ncbi:M3 family oligoendopeptidase [Roseospira visakhapatnamensis]|uniref:Oligoendopeptidase F n=1 Tax=Roseospira visakhapatnamensis TaxID=390880 RepID=A0A7W6RAJ3_9PROT|nr:M3 family oligoendopeptidase [Roseospira visakhapatnamensis]MBB4264954.1 oligoendopeptidase F [Roseospira visakhapatnamensis]
MPASDPLPPTHTPGPARAPEGGGGLSSTLPGWDLADLYGGMDDPVLESDLTAARASAAAFRERHLGQVAALSGADLGAAIAAFEAISETLYRIMSYAQLLHAVDQTDETIGRFHQGMQEKVTDISSLLLFFTLEINQLDDETLADKLTAPALNHYAAWIRTVRAFRDHELPEAMERLIHEKEVTGRAAWVRLFDETLAHLRFDIDGQSRTLTEALDQLSDTQRSRRESAARAIGAELAANARVFAHITNTLAKDKQIEDTWRRYPHALASRNLANQVEDEVVEALVTAVRDSYADTAHRYYALKARWFGQERLATWDRNAPLPDAEDRRYAWPEARDLVLNAYGAFSPRLAEVGQRFFDNAWIDVPPRPGKTSGAFAHPTVPSAHPYLLLNFMGRSRDVMTLAHELGHGVHQVLAAPRGVLMSDTPLTLAETASVFGEMLTFRAMLNAETDPKRRRTLLTGKVEDMLNTVVRQVAFHEFEYRVHRERREGALSEDRLSAIWMDVQRESLGPAFDFDDSYRVFWGYIPHFVHTPFYVYAYAFGDCLVNSLYAVHQAGTVPDFQEKYLDMLAAGGTLRHTELLAPFGLDARDPAFWRRGLGVLTTFIDELEQLA